MSTKNRFDYDKNRLTTTDEHGNRVYVHPEDVKGAWRFKRNIFYWGLVIIALILPWIHMGGKQWVRFDLPNREFHFFGLHLWGHEMPYIFLILAIALFAFAFITATLGRVWCGWACPQTVFIDTLYRGIERLVEGKSKERFALDESPWNLKKLAKRSLKWTLYLLISLLLAHTFIGYFVGTRELFHIVTQSPAAHWSAFWGTMFFTALFLFDFGWFREQFCLIACPYGRFQSVLMDKDSLIVAYDTNRGEPRLGQVKRDQAGDCINCYQCVKVCPTGIDIRNGNQLECIACTTCIDACDNIMTKLKRPKGLIRYTSENELEGKPHRIFTPRTFIYLGILLVFIASSVYLIGNKDSLRALFLRGNRDPYQLINRQGQAPLVVNHYKAELYYQGKENLELYFEFDPSLEKQGLILVTPLKPFKLSSSRKKVANLFFKFPPNFLHSGLRNIKVYIKDKEKLLETKEITLVGPINETGQ